MTQVQHRAVGGGQHGTGQATGAQSTFTGARSPLPAAPRALRAGRGELSTLHVLSPSHEAGR